MLQHYNSVGNNTSSFEQKPIKANFSSQLSDFKTSVKVAIPPGISLFPPQNNINDPYNNINIPAPNNNSSPFDYKEPHNINEENKIYSNAFPKENNSISSNVNINIKKNNVDSLHKAQYKIIDKNKDIASLLGNIAKKYHQSNPQKIEHILNNNQNNIQIINQGLNNVQNNEQVNQNVQNPENSQNFDDSIQGLKQLLLNQFLQIYGPQRQNNPSINLQNVQSNQKKEDRKSTSNKKSNIIGPESFVASTKLLDEATKLSGLIIIKKLIH